MNEPANRNQLELKNRLETSRSIVGIVSLLGWVGIFFELLVGDFYLDSLVWAIAYSIGLLYWRKAGLILSSPEDKELLSRQINTMKKYFKAYVIAWVLGGILTLFIWREIEVTTALAIILSLVATFMMSKFQGDAALLLIEE